MSFFHTRDAGALTSRCTLCGHVIRARADRDVYLEQRGHDAFTCQMRRAEATRHVEPEPDDDDRCPDGHERAGNTHMDPRGNLVCNACRREKYAASRQLKEAS